MSTATKPSRKQPSSSPDEVLTLAEAAAYLRVGEDAVLEAVRRQHLPGRKVRDEWRFLKSALQEWLRTPDDRSFWTTHLGALKDDPYLEEMVKQIYKERGRAAVEEG